MKERTKSVSDASLSEAMKAFQRDPGIATRLADRLTKLTGKRVWRQAVTLHLTGKVEPKHGMGLLIERNWRSCEVDRKSAGKAG